MHYKTKTFAIDRRHEKLDIEGETADQRRMGRLNENGKEAGGSQDTWEIIYGGSAAKSLGTRLSMASFFNKLQ